MLYVFILLVVVVVVVVVVIVVVVAAVAAAAASKLVIEFICKARLQSMSIRRASCCRPYTHSNSHLLRLHLNCSLVSVQITWKSVPNCWSTHTLLLTLLAVYGHFGSKTLRRQDISAAEEYCRSVRTLRQHCRCVLRTLRQCSRSVSWCVCVMC